MRSHHRTIAVLACFFTSFLTCNAEAAPQRVVSTFLCTDEYVFRLLPKERIAALSYEAVDRHPVVSTIADAALGLPVIRPSTETVMAKNPDLVVMYAGTNPRLHQNLQRLGVQILDVPWANSLTEIRQITLMLGDELGAPGKAKALVAEMDVRVARAKAAAPHPPVSAILYEPQGYAQVQGVTDEVLRLAGIVNAAPPNALTRAGQLPVEAVIATAPELLILGGEEKSGSARAYAVLHHPAFKALEGRTHMEFLTLTPLMCPGPWSVQSAAPLLGLAKRARTSRD
ncbi:iron complex transport system substrate-binding protein [Rhizomicrobium palustre]|uniref:Iron complex transport system substrate-binding protein n=1 Tax=Rhizomicrobium palustre TaxID=189966 RepID=A0A846MU43_9PROT|nr:ABC transporter substrate-binding protein [Rhizomicrobium palustre]NIK86873.1 iron complex transport system substrate-binding protein [Rhizomicrobium palustre]